MTRIQNVVLLKSNNLRHLLRELIKHQPISKVALAKKLHVGHSTITQILKPLIERNIVFEAAVGHSTGGRPPKLLRVNPDAAYGIVADMSGHRMRVCLINCAFDVVGAQGIAAQKDIYETLELVVKVCHDLLTRVNGGKVLGICVAISGVMDPATGRISSSLIEGLRDVKLRDFLKTRLGIPVIVENDANLSALGEFMKMEKDANNMFYIHMGEGLGGGLIVNRDIFRGDRGYAGEIGRMVYNADNFRTVGDVYTQLVKFSRVEEDDLVKLLTAVVLNAVSLLDVVNFVVGGTAFQIDERVLLKVENKVKELFYGFNVEIRKSTSQPDPILVGAMEYLIENVLTRSAI
ncbi:hypothetical protein AS159_01930 [Thermotoga sp. Ku-13t]|uniref:ROK family transcriptional regulator n=1 Tax=Thermotoga sp. Ku-13t TaxID=1755813 RepID=UPI0013EBFEA3|nr:ROK family transcriptional regulator [Thermotoga sp. Ku-13t]KAF2958483.1 hypothetical protein AS159_01930 [Thermotoga sp. Ku-13t]